MDEAMGRLEDISLDMRLVQVLEGAEMTLVHSGPMGEDRHTFPFEHIVIQKQIIKIMLAAVLFRS